ncbi:YbhN family protein [Lysobacter yangpyeongensis]|uniref:YbhN family protein n=1 Tax=Lysobacter yangpyeongensis TaxID=346182 RepID=A0ABW0SLJ1_9GAMM
MKPRHPLLRRLWRIAWWLSPLAILVLLARAARAIDWTHVLGAMAGYDATHLAIAALLTVASYLVYGAYDVAARRYAHHALSTRRVMLIAGIAYAFGLNIGALIGGTGSRLRLYSHAGLGVATIVRIVAFSASANWLGYVLLAGALFASGSTVLPPRFASAAQALPWLGVAMLVASALYLLACRRLHGRTFHWRHHHFRLPSLPQALGQYVLSMVNWSLMAAIVWVLLPASADYPTVLGTLLFSAIAAAMVHVPGGVGVLEAVFVAAFAHRMPVAAILAALLVYRAIYYLVPLLAAVAAYALLEARGRVPAAATTTPD